MAFLKQTTINDYVRLKNFDQTELILDYFFSIPNSQSQLFRLFRGPELFVIFYTILHTVTIPSLFKNKLLNCKTLHVNWAKYLYLPDIESVEKLSTFKDFWEDPFHFGNVVKSVYNSRYLNIPKNILSVMYLKQRNYDPKFLLTTIQTPSAKKYWQTQFTFASDKYLVEILNPKIKNSIAESEIFCIGDFERININNTEEKFNKFEKRFKDHFNLNTLFSKNSNYFKLYFDISKQSKLKQIIRECAHKVIEQRDLYRLHFKSNQDKILHTFKFPINKENFNDIIKKIQDGNILKDFHDYHWPFFRQLKESSIINDEALFSKEHYKSLSFPDKEKSNDDITDLSNVWNNSWTRNFTMEAIKAIYDFFFVDHMLTYAQTIISPPTSYSLTIYQKLQSFSLYLLIAFSEKLRIFLQETNDLEYPHDRNNLISNAEYLVAMEIYKIHLEEVEYTSVSGFSDLYNHFINFWQRVEEQKKFTSKKPSSDGEVKIEQHRFFLTTGKMKFNESLIFPDLMLKKTNSPKILSQFPLQFTNSENIYVFLFKGGLEPIFNLSELSFSFAHAIITPQGNLVMRNNYIKTHSKTLTYHGKDILNVLDNLNQHIITKNNKLFTEYNGFCCFCGKRLSSPETKKGFGKSCAKVFDLFWKTSLSEIENLNKRKHDQDDDDLLQTIKKI